MRREEVGFATISVCSDLRARNNVALEVVVDVGGVTRVGGLDVAWDLDSGAGLA
jgi:hypothetical protein